MRTSRALRAAVGAAALSFAVCSAAAADDDDDDDGPARDLECIGCVGTGDIAAGAVTSEKLASEAVTGEKLAPGAVTRDRLAPGSVGFGELSSDVVTAIEEGGGSDPVTLVLACGVDGTLQGTLDAIPQGQVTTIVLNGDCDEIATIRKDDITIDGDATGSGPTGVLARVTGLRIEGARRIKIRNVSLRPNGQSSTLGLLATQGSQFVLSGSQVRDHDFGGIDVREGSTAVIEDSTIEQIGIFSAEFAGGIRITDGSSAEIRNNLITTNFGDGIWVSHGAFARVEENTIEFCGRPSTNLDSFGEAGIRVTDARVQANGNINRNPTNLNLLVEDGGVYRTGRTLNRWIPDNPLGFEEIDAGVDGFAVVLDQGSEAILRQVNVTGRVVVTFSSNFLISGDAEEPNLQRATLTGDARAVVNSLIRVTNTVDFTGVCEGRGDSNCFLP